MARLRTPHWTTAVRDRGSIFRMRLNRASDKRHAQRVGHGAAGQAGARAPRHHGNPQRMAGLQHFLDLDLGFGQCHRQRPLPVGRQPVALIGRGVLRIPEQGMGGQHAAQGADHLGLALGAFGGGGRFGVHDRTVGEAERPRSIFTWQKMQLQRRSLGSSPCDEGGSILLRMRKIKSALLKRWHHVGNKTEFWTERVTS